MAGLTFINGKFKITKTGKPFLSTIGIILNENAPYLLYITKSDFKAPYNFNNEDSNSRSSKKIFLIRKVEILGANNVPERVVRIKSFIERSNFYYSTGYDDQYVWNKLMIENLKKYTKVGNIATNIPFVYLYAGYVNTASSGNYCSTIVSLICTNKIGPRLFCRGADMEGNVSFFVKTAYAVSENSTVGFSLSSDDVSILIDHETIKSSDDAIKIGDNFMQCMNYETINNVARMNKDTATKDPLKMIIKENNLKRRNESTNPSGKSSSTTSRHSITTSDKRHTTNTEIFKIMMFRGSIPLIWSQSLTKIKINPNSLPAFQNHFKQLPQNTIVINLLNQEDKLCRQYEHFLNEHKIKFLTFDLNKHKNNYKHMKSAFFAALDDFFSRMRFSEVRHGNLHKLYTFRINCMDCLDRTNIAQCLLVDYLINTTSYKCIIENDNDNTKPNNDLAYNYNIAQQLKRLFYENGNALSNFYAGSNALRGDIIKGKRSIAGRVGDIVSTASRIINYKTTDKIKKEIIDDMLGKKDLNFRDFEELFDVFENSCEEQ